MINDKICNRIASIYYLPSVIVALLTHPLQL